MKILNYGSMNIDIVYTVPNIVRPGETISSSKIQQFAGGKGANQSVALAKAGAEVWHAGKIGEDGNWLMDKLKSFSVKTDLIKKYEGSTGQAIIQVTPEAENSIILFGGGNQSIKEEEIVEIFSHFEDGDYLVLQNEINFVPKIIQTAREKGMKICLNPAPFDESINSWPLDMVDILIVNELEAEGLAGISGSFEEVLDHLTKQYVDTDIVMTVGEAGAYYGRNEKRVHVAITKTKAVDTTAAGDTFLGYYLASRISGYEVKESMERASKASSITVSRPGAMDSIPMVEEIE
ncbi:MAG: ribokinase, partial [Tenericutes bacterium 4572_104]